MKITRKMDVNVKRSLETPASMPINKFPCQTLIASQTLQRKSKRLAVINEGRRLISGRNFNLYRATNLPRNFPVIPDV